MSRVRGSQLRALGAYPSPALASLGQRECISCYRLDRTAGEHDDFGAGRRALVEVDHIFVAHTDAAGGHVMTDTLGLIGTVNAIERVDLALPKIERAGAQRIIGPAMMP